MVQGWSKGSRDACVSVIVRVPLQFGARQILFFQGVP